MLIGASPIFIAKIQGLVTTSDLIIHVLFCFSLIGGLYGPISKRAKVGDKEARWQEAKKAMMESGMLMYSLAEGKKMTTETSSPGQSTMP
jgi:hypothetical protein